MENKNQNKKTSVYPNVVPKTPCWGCTPETGRCGTCHSTCSKYKEWKILHEQERVREYQVRKTEYDVIGSNIESNRIYIKNGRRSFKGRIMKGTSV